MVLLKRRVQGVQSSTDQMAYLKCPEMIRNVNLVNQTIKPMTPRTLLSFYGFLIRRASSGAC